MSRYPPNGQPPQPYYGYPQHPPMHPPPPGGFAYVPAPIMMYPPLPQPVVPETQPTFVTNYIYPQQAAPPPDGGLLPHETPRIVEDVIDWVPATAATAVNFSSRAVQAGREGWDGSLLWVIRAHHSGDLIPGKLAVKHRSAYIAYCGKEVPVHNFEVMCAQPSAIRWLPASNGQVPVGAIVGGNTVNGEPLYIGRAKHQLSLTPGKVHCSHGCCYISFGGSEVSHKYYEVLCKIVG